jgi:hypothetical protein
VALVRTDVSDERIASNIRVTRHYVLKMITKKICDHTYGTWQFLKAGEVAEATY